MHRVRQYNDLAHASPPQLSKLTGIANENAQCAQIIGIFTSLGEYLLSEERLFVERQEPLGLLIRLQRLPKPLP